MKLVQIEEICMKKVLIILLIMILTLTGCQKNNIQIGNLMVDINKQHTPFIFLNTLSVF